ncbi:MAG: hypothetical protein ACKO8I_07060 [Cyanobacteriota bacterium]
MNHASMAGLESQGIASHGPMPAGMLRIRKGSEERYVWPVHLPGWLALGWRVAGQGSELTGDQRLSPVPIVAPEVVLEPEAGSAELTASEPSAPAEPPAAPTRARRGRPRKEKVDIAPVEPAAEAAGESTSEVLPGAAEAVAPFGDNSAGPATTSPEESSPPTDEPDPLLTALPDDLFEDPLL